MLEFPHCLLREQATDRPRLVGAARTGGRSASGVITMSRTDGGGLWAYGLQSISIITSEHVRAFEAITTLMAEGARPIVVPICNKRYMPAPLDANGQPIYAIGCVTHSDTTHFSDSACYVQRIISVFVSVTAPLRGTVLQVTTGPIGALRGGELFSIQHQTLGWRFYRIVAVYSQNPTNAVIQIEPPLREAVAANAGLEFEEPRCVMQLAEPASLQLELRRHGRPSLAFIESFLPLD